MRLLLVQLWPIWLLLGIAIAVILIVNKKKEGEENEETPSIIGLSRSGFLIICLIFGTIITGFIWLGSKIEKDTSHNYMPSQMVDGQLKQGNVK